jgi:beta-lactamase regulating signal transducer with metallopeptidase domain
MIKIRNFDQEFTVDGLVVTSATSRETREMAEMIISIYKLFQNMSYSPNRDKDFGLWAKERYGYEIVDYTKKDNSDYPKDAIF